jgi:hypothetical protein
MMWGLTRDFAEEIERLNFQSMVFAGKSRRLAWEKE